MGLTGAGQPYTVFTPYSKAWKTRAMPGPWPKPGRASRVLPEFPSEELPLDPATFGFPLRQTLPAAGERAGADALKLFVAQGAAKYASQRDFPALAGTSLLSPHLRAGTVGIRSVLSRLARAEAEAGPSGRRDFEVFRNELIWREFYLQVLANFPHVSQSCFRSRYNRLAWSGTDEEFAAWRQGLTGYPIVDAAMRCLNATGWMHNRLRMIVAMFLAKDLLVDWRRGERYFMQQLVDGDMAANNGGWQWSAGTGTDAAPYFRIFNPTAQGEKFDPDGSFTRQWLPELAGFAGDSIHQPWRQPLAARAAGYPDRIVAHDEQRLKCLAMFDRLKGGE
jgi:deoxyribodipyrimidine photo-lyase